MSLDSVDLFWLPLGAGDVVVQHSGRWFEALVAARAHRERHDLYHSALEVHWHGERFVIEMAPVWGNKGPERGASVKAPSGILCWAGRGSSAMRCAAGAMA